MAILAMSPMAILPMVFYLHVLDSSIIAHYRSMSDYPSFSC
jgi:hypothetical protein